LDIYEFLKSTILELNDVDEERFTPALRVDDLALDSLDYVQIQVSVKKKYGVQIDPGVFTSGNVQTVDDLCRYIQSSRSSVVAS